MREKSHCPYCGSVLAERVVERSLRKCCDTCHEVLYDNPVPAVCAVVADHGDRILLVRRGVPPKVGFWCLPGGFMELDESPEEAALRELREETGVTGRIVRLLGLRATPSRIYRSVLLAGYLVLPQGGEAAPGSDALEVGWFTVEGLPEIAFESHRTFIRQFSTAYTRTSDLRGPGDLPPGGP
jgi:ADP-ribose pyrophosphatase YjhB (NUDIX family)